MTLGGRTEAVEFTLSTDGKHAWSAPIFAARIGRGTKLHRVPMSAWLFEDFQAARSRGYAKWDVIEVEGGVWGFKRVSTALNRQAHIVAFADDIEGTERGSKHISQGIK